MTLTYYFTRCDGTRLVLEYPFTPMQWDEPARELENDSIFVLEIFESEQCYRCHVELICYDAGTDTEEIVWEKTYSLADYKCNTCEEYNELNKHGMCDSCADRFE